MKEFDYSTASSYFITICSKDRVDLFSRIVDGQIVSNDLGEIVVNKWKSIEDKYKSVILDEFIIMPNHLHGIIGIIDPAGVGAIHELPPVDRRKMLIPKIIGYFKMTSAKEINIARGTPGQNVWQRNYYETIIRSEKQLQALREYINNNPKNWSIDPERSM